MKQVLFVAAVAAVLAGCAVGSNERFDRKAEAERERMTT